MESSLNNGYTVAPGSGSKAQTPAQPLEQGKWVAVNQSKLGFNVNAPQGQPVKGPDGAIYCVGESRPQLGQVDANMQNAVPAPSGIIQMPPIVQPIALVPYTSQNQPLLQYDPYSRIVEPETTPKTPTYVRKPYSGISIAAFLISIIGLVLLLIGTLLKFAATEARVAFEGTGLVFITAAIDIIAGGATGSAYYTQVIDKLGSVSTMDKIFYYALPFIAVVAALLFLVLVFKYLAKFAGKKTPRAFSVCAFIDMILFTLTFVIGLILSGDASGFIGGGAAISMGIFLIVEFVISLILFILPFFAKKNAYKMERDDPARKTFIIND